MMNLSRRDLANDLVLPTVLFAAVGGMTWAVRGSSGFGGGAGCIFAGVMWGAAWWYCAHDPAREQSRRYASGWIVLALTFGIGISGQRGWMQWPHFFLGKLFTNWANQEFVPISSAYGFLWLFIAGVPWAGLGACFLAWCGSRRETRVWHWLLRIACGVGMGMLARYLFDQYPQFFLPLYESMESRYHDFDANPNLKRVINDCGAAITHFGYYLGFLLFEAGRKDWKNVVLILTVGLVNGAGWAALQNWQWAPGLWKDANFNWWRCWESSGGISMGVAYGIAYFLVNRRMSDAERSIVASRPAISGPNFEWLLIFSGLAAVLSLYARGLTGWPIYFGVVILFAALYYFRYRKSPVDELPTTPRWFAMVTNLEWGAVCVIAALTVPLFTGREVVQSLGDLHLQLLYVGFVIACGVAWYLIRRKTFDEERKTGTPIDGDPNLERLGLYLGLLAGLGLSLFNGLNGWFGIYRHESSGRSLWYTLGPVYLLLLTAMLAWVLLRPIPRNYRGNIHRNASGAMWLVLIVQNVIAQLVTGPLSEWNEMAFNIYYLLLFTITAVIVFHLQTIKCRMHLHQMHHENFGDAALNCLGRYQE
jgi:hypothetical protein